MPPKLVECSERFKHIDKKFFEHLASSPTKFARSGVLRDSNLWECSCEVTNAHNRACPGNTRTKMEELIVRHITQRFRERSIKLLSLGSGGCLQDLILVAKLIAAGLHSIHITLVEPDKSWELAYQDFAYLLTKMQTVYGADLQLSWTIAQSIDEINAPFDVVYAIDYEEYEPGRDYSDRKLPERAKQLPGSRGKFNENWVDRSYFANIDLIKAANLTEFLKDALVIMSRGKNIISLTPETAKSYFNELKPCADLGKDLSRTSTFYLNADISNLPIYLAYLMKAQKPLWINQAILRAEDRDTVAEFLGYCHIPCTYVDDSLVVESADKVKGSVLILDCTPFDTERGETPIEERYINRNFLVVRCDWAKYGNTTKKQLVYSACKKHVSNAVQKEL